VDYLRIIRPDNFHCHLRQGKLLERVVGYTARSFARALIMPNIRMPGYNVREDLPAPPVRFASDVLWYRQHIMNAVPVHLRRDFEPLMTISIADQTTPDDILAAKAVGVVAGKIYPVGLTSNSEYGVSDFGAASLQDTLAAMEESGLVLCLHGEAVGSFCLDREPDFLSTLINIVGRFPRLRVVLEHVSTQQAVQCIESLPGNVAASITVHHLYLTLDDVIGDLLSPHNYCKPLPKRPEDRRALIAAAISGSPKFFLGTDSAPHERSAKECSAGCAGIYSDPVALGLLADLFEQYSALDGLERFVSICGADFYGLTRNRQEIVLVRQPEKIPASFNGLVPFRAGRQMSWKLS